MLGLPPTESCVIMLLCGQQVHLRTDRKLLYVSNAACFAALRQSVKIMVSSVHLKRIQFGLFWTLKTKNDQLNNNNNQYKYRDLILNSPNYNKHGCLCTFKLIVTNMETIKTQDLFYHIHHNVKKTSLSMPSFLNNLLNF